MNKNLILAAALALAAATLSAADAPSRAGKFGIGLGAGYNSHAMADVNENRSASITGGIGAALDLKWRAAEKYTAGLEVELLYPQRRETTSPLLPGYKATENYSGLGVNLGGFYTIPNGSTDFRLGGAVGYYSLSGATYESSTPLGTTSYSMTASSVGAKIGGGVDWYLSPSFSLSLDLGYRLASLKPLTFDGKEVKNSKNESVAVDYSGLYSKIGIGVWF